MSYDYSLDNLIFPFSNFKKLWSSSLISEDFLDQIIQDLLLKVRFSLISIQKFFLFNKKT